MKLIKKTVTVETFICEASECTCNCGTCICGVCTCSNCNCDCNCGACPCACSSNICNCNPDHAMSSIYGMAAMYPTAINSNTLTALMSNDHSARFSFQTSDGDRGNARYASYTFSMNNTRNGYSHGGTSTNAKIDHAEM